MADSQSNAQKRIPFYARRFVAGSAASDAVTVASSLKQQQIGSTLDLLGENLTDRDRILGAAASYLDLLDSMQKASVPANISIKLTMLGLDLDASLCFDLTSQVTARADAYGGRVCLDMEGTAYTERTLAMYEKLSTVYRSPEIVLQAYLHRTREDIGRVLAAGGRMRLCKGAYKEAPAVALQQMTAIRQNYLALLETLLNKGKRICIATHDDILIAEAESIIKGLKVSNEDEIKDKIPADRYEFQMLYGLRRNTWSELVNRGHNFTVYVPFGVDWQAYYKRRLAERKENVFFILRNLFRG
jgi:proline dehydrogenase